MGPHFVRVDYSLPSIERKGLQRVSKPIIDHVICSLLDRDFEVCESMPLQILNFDNKYALHLACRVHLLHAVLRHSMGWTQNRLTSVSISAVNSVGFGKTRKGHVLAARTGVLTHNAQLARRPCLLRRRDRNESMARCQLHRNVHLPRCDRCIAVQLFTSLNVMCPHVAIPEFRGHHVRERVLMRSQRFQQAWFSMSLTVHACNKVAVHELMKHGMVSAIAT
jgi:hypothetical protein